MPQISQPHGARQRWLKPSLGLSYLFLLAQMADIYYAGTIADERSLDGAAVAWFGVYWPLVMLTTLVAIVWLHIALILGRRRNGK